MSFAVTVVFQASNAPEEPPEEEDGDPGDEANYLNTTDSMQREFRQIHEIRGYAQPLYSSGFSESLLLLEL